jgi:nicotinate-nucleotide pyrophosphorylase (carboxylating)
MQACAGVSRSAQGLGELAGYLAGDDGGPADEGPAGWELANMVLIARAVTALASARHESRGAHWRADYPEPRPEWCVRQVAQLVAGGDLAVAHLGVGHGGAGHLRPAAAAAV